MKTPDNIESYGDNYSESKFWDKLATTAKKAGAKVVYLALLLYYVLMSPNVSKGDKTIIIGALGYLILPVDLIPDFIVGLGFTDDAAALIWAYRKISTNITPDIEQQAKAKLADWFGDVEENDIKI